MNFNLPKLSTNFWIIIGTITFLILSYFFYLEYYVAAKESRIISTRFRVLDQLGDNITAKIESYNSNALQLEQKIRAEVDLLKSQLDTPKKAYPKEIIVAWLFKRLVKGDYQKSWEFLNKDLQVIDYKLDNGGPGGTTDSGNNENTKLSKTETDKFFYLKPLRVETISKAKGVTETFYDSLLVRTEYSKLLGGLSRDDVFDEMFIIRGGNIVFSTLKSDLLIAQSDTPFTFQEESATKEESLEKSGPKSSLPGRILSGEYSDITVSNKAYKLFFKPVKVEGENWYLGGLMEAGNFNAAGRSIAPWVIVILTLLLIVIVLSLPLIKLKVISKTEHLKTETIINSALSILFGASVLALILLYISQNSSHKQNTDTRLKRLSAAIDSSFTEEITNAFAQLKEFDLHHNKLVPGSNKTEDDKPIFDEILNQPIDNLGFPSIYPFADYIFWMNKKGVQTAYFTPFVDEKGEMTDLSSRDYFKYKDKWFFPPDPNEKFRLQSIFSITSGNHKVAIATRSSDTNSPVIALSSQFYSLIDPIIPKNYGYCIIDKSGKVWFHSNKERNLMENFISECNDNKYLKATIYNRTSKPIYASYYNKPHRVFIQPLNHLPLYLITFYNRDNETSFQAQVFTMVLILISVFFLFIFLQVIIILTLERQYQWKLTKNLIMKITRPMLHLISHYRFLIWVYLIVAIATVVGISFMGKIQSFATVYILEVIIFTFSYRALNDNKLKVMQRKWFTLINLVLLILMNIGLFSFLSLFDAFFALGLQLFLIFFLELAYQLFKRNPKKIKPLINRAFIRNYVMHLLFISFIFAIVPTMTFYKIAHDTESEIRTRHCQVDLMKKHEKRNQFWNKYYESIISSKDSVVKSGPSIKILQDRKKRGIYTNFLNDLEFSAEIDNQENQHQHSIFDTLAVFMRPFYDEEIVENKYLIFGNQKYSHKYWVEDTENALALNYISKTEDPKSAKLNYYRIAGRVEKLNFLMPYHGAAFDGTKEIISNLLFWLLMLFALYIYYHLIRFGIRNIYSLDIVANYSDEPFEKIIRQQMLANKDIFVIKLSPKDETLSLSKSIQIDHQLNWSDKKTITQSTKQINKWLTEYQTKQVHIESPTVKPGKTNSNKVKENEFVTIFINHFEWDYTNPEILNEKLGILWTFINRKEIQLIIQSIVHPAKIVAYYEDIIDIHSKDNGKDSHITDITLHKNILNNLQQLMNNTIINLLPVKCSCKEGAAPCAKPRVKLSLKGLIEDELNASDYLFQFKGALEAYYDSYIKDSKLENPEELIIVKINSLADNYYEDLFNACSAEEQYVMFDLADDLIVNPKNSKAIFGLLEKGIVIIKCDKINFMNVSFRRFVLSKLNKSDTSALEIQIGKEPGTWQGYRITLILIIIGLFTFIAMANQGFMENLNEVFVVIGGGVAVITGVLGLLSRKSESVTD